MKKKRLSFLHRTLFAHPARRLKKIMPKSLFGRTLLILVIPTILTLVVATFVFFDRHWSTTTHRLAHAVAGEIAVSVDLLESARDAEEEKQIINTLTKRMDLSLLVRNEGRLPVKTGTFISPIEDMLRQALRERVPFPTSIPRRTSSRSFAVAVRTPKKFYVFSIPARRVYTPTTEVFIGWMIGSSVLLSAIALLFMRNQVRPVRRLAAAAEAIGRGRDVPWFKPEGAAEVRQASTALMHMRDRLRRSVGQRTAMLAGVSHDLRTPLTRMKLALEMLPETGQTRGIKDDITEMEGMLEAYLAFARGEEAETPSSVDLAALIHDVARKTDAPVTVEVRTPVTATLRVGAVRRCLTNLIANAARYGKTVRITLAQRGTSVDIFVDDDGPGIPANRREDVFRPFFRLEESRNTTTGGVGLGLSVARDIARNHGGNIILGTSPLGGLRAHLWIPV